MNINVPVSAAPARARPAQNNPGTPQDTDCQCSDCVPARQERRNSTRRRQLYDAEEHPMVTINICL